MIIVAGGLGILGRAVAAQLVAQGDEVCVVDMAEASVSDGISLVVGGIDLADETAVSAAVEQMAERGPITGLVNVAGGFAWETIGGGSLQTWDRLYRMNLRTVAATTSAALPHLRRTKGAIVNVGAAAALHDVATGMAPYAASKAGVKALTESLANELRGEGLRVNAVLPTIIDTPANRADMPDADPSTWVQPSAIAEVVAFLLSSGAASISGESIRLSLPGRN